MGSGVGAGTASSAGTVFGAFGLFFEPGGLPLRLGTGAGSAGFGGSGTGCGVAAGSAAGSVAGSAAGSAASGVDGSARAFATGGSTLSAIFLD